MDFETYLFVFTGYATGILKIRMEHFQKNMLKPNYFDLKLGIRKILQEIVRISWY